MLCALFLRACQLKLSSGTLLLQDVQFISQPLAKIRFREHPIRDERLEPNERGVERSW